MRSPTLIPPRWTKLRRHPVQHAYWNSPHRFNVVPAGRRSGKTELAKRKLVLRALSAHQYPDCRFFAGAPTRDQAKRIFWNDLKALIPPRFIIDKPREGELYIPLINGASLWVLGFDKPERVEGTAWDGGVLDEYGNMKPSVWAEHVRPALSDRFGWCDLIGVPEGRNHYYDRAEDAKAQMIERGRLAEWAVYHWKSADILPASEIESARRDLDELTFQQEYEASFVNFQGRAYYVFDETKHCARLSYNPRAPISFCFDFNVDPGIAVITQEQALPSGQTGTGVIGEVWIPRGSNTIAVCNKLAADWGTHPGLARCYGDATGGARGSAKVIGSDWAIIKTALRPVFGDRVTYRVPRANPPERSRVNAMNTRLLNQAGQVHMMIDPSRAPRTKKDLEGVRVLEGGSGELDKKHDPQLTHLSDGLGYYVVYEFPIEPRQIEKIALAGV